MAYVNVADWRSEQVAEWLKGLDSVILQYIRLFIERNVNGQQLLDLQSNDLEEIGVYKIGHQEIILEAVELLKNFYYDLDRENLQLLALRLSSLAHSLHSELWKNHISSSVVSTQVLADVANVVSAVKPLVCWLDRSPFSDQLTYIDKKNELLKLSLEMAMSGMRDRFVDKPIEYIRRSCQQLAELADTIIQNIDDSLLLQPASLGLATLKKRPGDHLGFYIVPSFHGILQVGELKCNSAAHQSGKIETGDEIVQINYQTVVGWEVKEVMSLLFEESSTEILMTLKKRPRHSKVFGQIYIKPYRLPCKKQMNYSTWNDILSPARPELLTVPLHFGTQIKSFNLKPAVNVVESHSTDLVSPPSPTPSTVSNSSSRSSESELMVGPSSPNSVRLYLPKPRIPVQRRATITGASPVSKHAPLSLEQFWHELKLEREWRSSSDEKTGEKINSDSELKRPPIHCSLDILPSIISNENKITEKKNLENNGIIPLKERIDLLNRAIEQTNKKKPKVPLKPLLSSNKQNTRLEKSNKITPFNPPYSNESDSSIRRERGKLDKSYSTPSYDYSIDSKEPLKFNMKFPEGKVKSAPENITSEVEFVPQFKMSFENVKSFADTKIDKTNQCNSSIKQDTEVKIQNEYLEIKSDDVIKNNNLSVHEKLPCAVKDSYVDANKLASKINALLNINNELEFCSFKQNEQNFVSTTRNYISPTTSENLCDTETTSLCEKIETKNITNDVLSDNLIVSPLMNASRISSERFVVHTDNAPATFPRHKMEYKKLISPPEPPPRPVKDSNLHPKVNYKQITLTKNSKNISNKSPKSSRNKNILLIKRRNVSVKELGICDHEGWLFHRSRKTSRGSPQWIKGWFIIKGTLFYGYNSLEASRARLMISLPGFTVSPAEEVKSRNFSFKVYHTGTTFYFSAESAEDLAGWVESFSKVTVSKEEQSVVVSETDGEDDDENQLLKKDRSGHESYAPHVAAMKKLSGLLSSHLSSKQEILKGGSDKKYNSLKKNILNKSNKEDQQIENSISSLDRKYLKFLSSGVKQNFVPVPTAQFRSYRRVPPLEKPPSNCQESVLSSDSKSNSATCIQPIPSASPTRPPDMADYRLASWAKCNVNNQRTTETSQTGGYMTLESFMLSRQEEERRHQMQHPRVTNILRVPQCHAPPPPIHIINLNAAAVTGHENLSSTSTHFNLPIQTTSQLNPSHKLTDIAITNDPRQKFIKKTPLHQSFLSEHSRNNELNIQPPDLNNSVENSFPINKIKKFIEVQSPSQNFKKLCINAKSDVQKTNIPSSSCPDERIFCNKNDENNILRMDNISDLKNLSNDDMNISPEIVVCVSQTDERFFDVSEYPRLEYPPVFEPGTYSLSDVSTLFHTRSIPLDSSETEAIFRHNENYFGLEDIIHKTSNQHRICNKTQGPNQKDNGGTENKHKHNDNFLL